MMIPRCGLLTRLRTVGLELSQKKFAGAGRRNPASGVFPGDWGGGKEVNNPTVEEILRDWFKQHGYDGLYYDDWGPEDICGCSLDDFMPCGEVDLHCKAGYKAPDPTGKLDFLIYPKKAKEKIN